MTLQDIFPSIAELSDWIGLGLLALVLLAFVTERIAPVAVAVVGAALMAALGYLAFDDLRLVFSNPAPLTIGAMFVLSAALVRTGVIEELASLATNRAKEAPKRSLAELFGGSFIGSAFINNTPIVIILTPVMRRLASVTKISHKRLLIPLSYVTIMGGSLTLIGTSTNLLVDGVARSSGEPAFGMFDLTLIGLVSGAIGFATLLLLGQWLLPSEARQPHRSGRRGPEGRETRKLSDRSPHHRRQRMVRQDRGRASRAEAVRRAVARHRSRRGDPAKPARRLHPAER